MKEGILVTWSDGREVIIPLENFPCRVSVVLSGVVSVTVMYADGRTIADIVGSVDGVDLGKPMPTCEVGS